MSSWTAMRAGAGENGRFSPAVMPGATPPPPRPPRPATPSSHRDRRLDIMHHVARFCKKIVRTSPIL